MTTSHKTKNLQDNTLQAKGDKSDTIQSTFICYLFCHASSSLIDKSTIILLYMRSIQKNLLPQQPFTYIPSELYELPALVGREPQHISKKQDNRARPFFTFSKDSVLIGIR